MKKNRIIVVGGGSAGLIAATYLKKYWGEHIQLTLIYDHSKPGIGVGESLTPIIYKYLDYIGVTRDDIVKNVHGTVKLGLKFKNWLNDGNYFYHNFLEFDASYYNYAAGYDIINKIYDNDTTYGNYYFENNLIPKDPKATQSLHFDAVLLSKYLEERFKNDLEIIDDEVVKVNVTNNNEIDNLILKNKGIIKGDFYIDASGFQSVLFKNLKNNWVDRSKWLPLNKCIPNPAKYDFVEQPVYTTSEASEQGWILQVPLSNRWGAGYLYCSDFITDEKAFENFSLFVEKTYNQKLTNTSKVLSFKSGFWENQWVGNCIAVGLSSGFSEPLEATNIHHTVMQVMKFAQLYNFKCYEFDRRNYNRLMKDTYENIYLYLRFCYTTNRTDSEFWRYMTNNVPEEVKYLDEKIKTDLLSQESLNGEVFNYGNFTRVAYGLKKIKEECYRDGLIYRKALDVGKIESDYYKKQRTINLSIALNHKKYINKLLKNKE
jgi:tryptophan halogenase